MKEITPKMIESLPEYGGEYNSSIMNEIYFDKKYKDKWNYIYKENKMTINKGEKLSWKEVLKIVRDEIIKLEKNEI